MVCPKCNKQIQDKISFCPHCGAYVNKPQDGFKTFESSLPAEKVDEINDNVKSGLKPIKIEKDTKNAAIKIEKKDNRGISILLYVCTISLWIFAVYLIINGTKNDYFFSDNGNDNPPVQENPNSTENNYTGVSKSGQNNLTSTNLTTSIVYDNQYLRQTIFNTVEDVYNLIEYDSTSQKKSCPAYSKVIEDSIIKNYKIIAVNLCEIDENFQMELAEVARFYYEKYPKARSYLTNLTIANVDENVTYMAAFMPLFAVGTSNTSSGYPIAYKTQIILNAKYFIDASKVEVSVANGANGGYFPKDATRSSAVAHEFGHYISYVAMLNYYNTSGFVLTKQSQSDLLYKVYNDFNAGDFSYMVLNEAYANYSGKKSFDDFRASISQYAVAKNKNGNYIYDETIAEAFHDYYLHGNNANEASLLIIKALEKYL